MAQEISGLCELWMKKEDILNTCWNIFILRYVQTGCGDKPDALISLYNKKV